VHEALCVHDSVGTLPYLQVHCTAAATAAAVLTAYTNMIQRCNSTNPKRSSQQPLCHNQWQLEVQCV
jgi:hypothetical protein